MHAYGVSTVPPDHVVAQIGRGRHREEDNGHQHTRSNTVLAGVEVASETGLGYVEQRVHCEMLNQFRLNN